MKLQTRLELVIITIFLLGWLITGASVYTVEQRDAREQIVRSAEVLLRTAVATRKYNLNEVQPILYKYDEEEFFPESAPSYAVQNVFGYLNQDYPGYNYVERALNPTNPKDLAEGWQVELIQSFIENPKVKEIIGRRITKVGKEVLYVAQPIQIKTEACLECHSTPEVAPRSFLKMYGSTHGFGWKLNEIIGTRLITVPTSIPKQQAKDAISCYLLVIGSIFLIAYTAVSLIVKNWLIKPLDNIAHLVEEISLRKVEMSPLAEERTDELGNLSKSINRLLVSLKKSLSR
ncbi:MAG: DUF3365 domain-containing protein [Oscillatoria sp. PMC 1068.18]|nr:DUF3365 domain-containing protein [Oscillatoria sp. PMC 1076.18]MEC4991377.1 DUF3365 domain-containing protein [Oscillatoria sp. PMC 1068.18]